MDIQWNTTHFTKLYELPPRSGVYLVSTDHPLYVGKSENMKLRWKNHSAGLDLALRGASELQWYECPIDQAAILERQLIATLNPELNMRNEEPRRTAGRTWPPSPIPFTGSGHIVSVDAFRCSQCAHIWLAVASNPSHCARCKSRLWKNH